MATTSPSKYVDFDEYIDFQLRKTRANIKTTDILTALAGVGTMFLAYLLVFVVFDHWIVDGGFSTGARWLMLGGLMIASTAWVIWRVVLPSRRNVTGLYAARAIEETEPELKHSLMNLVDLKQAGRPVPVEIERALQKRAAVTLHKGDVDAAIDRRPLMRLSYALLALVVLCCLYAVFSPKRISASVWRALFPASSTAVDTAIKVDRITAKWREDDKDKSVVVLKEGEEDGNPVNIASGTRVMVEVDLKFSGDAPESVTMFFSTADGKFRDVEVAMKMHAEVPKRYYARLEGGFGRGIRQDTTIRIEAGDAKAGPFDVTVVRPPVATVRKVKYDYPAYMRRESRTQDGGHIETWEGTDVTVSAETDKPVEKAWLVFTKTEDVSKKAVHKVAMRIDGGTKLSVKLANEITLCDGSHPHFYHIECVGKSGYKDPDPAVYGVTIRQDRRPRIQLLDPKKNEIELPANARFLPVLYKADDDFGVQSVTLKYHITRKGLKREPELTAPVYKGGEKSLQKSYSWRLVHHQFQPGDVAEFLLHVRDNMPPRTRTAPWCGAKQARLNDSETRKVIVRFIEKQDQDAVNQQQQQKRKQQQQQQKEHEKNKADRKPQQKNDNAQPQDDKKKPDEGDPRKKQQPDQGQKKPQKNGMGEAGQPMPGQEGGMGMDDPNKDGMGQQADQRQGGDGDNQRPPMTDRERTEQLLRDQKQREEQARKQKPQNKQGGDSKSGTQQGNKTKQNPNGGGNQNAKQPNPNQKKQAAGDKKQEPPQAKKNTGMGDKKKEPNPNGGDKKSQKKPNGDAKKKQQSPGPMNGMGDNGMNKKQTAKEPGGKKQGTQKQPGDGNKEPKNGAGASKKKQPSQGAKKQPDGMGGGNADGMNNDAKKKPGGTADQQGMNSTGTKKKPGDDRKRKSDGDGEGPEKTVNDDGTPAKKKQATGNEKGNVKPEDDPNSNPTKAKDPSKLKKDPKDKTQKRQRRGMGDPMGNKKVGSNDPTKGKSRPKTDQNPVEKKTPGSKQQEKKETSKTPNKQNDPGNDPSKGMGRKKQKSKSSDGGEDGRTTPRNDGTKGSRQKGPGDKTQKKGQRQNAGDKKTGTPGKTPGKGSRKQPGQGNKQGGAKKQGGQKSDPGQGNAAGKSKTQGNNGQAGNNPGQSGDLPRSKRGDRKRRPNEVNPGGGKQAGRGNYTPPEDEQKRDAEDLKHGRNATNLVLDKLGDKVKRGELTKDDLKKLGFDSNEQVTDYIKRERNRIKNAERNSQTKEWLKSIRYRDFQKNLKKRTGENVRQKAIDGVGTEGKEDIPAHLRRYYNAFRRSVSK